MPPATRTTRRSLRSRRATSPPNEELDTKNSTLSANESILRHPSTSGSDGDQADHQHKKKSSSAKSNRSVTFSFGEDQSPPSPSVSDTSISIKGNITGTATGNGLSARAKRSKRRQAKIEKDPAKKVSSTGKKGTIKKSVESSIKKEFSKAHSSSSNGRTIMKKGAGGKDEEVVKVKLNTGTLYLYKGLHRRAVFVRRV